MKEENFLTLRPSSHARLEERRGQISVWSIKAVHSSPSHMPHNTSKEGHDVLTRCILCSSFLTNVSLWGATVVGSNAIIGSKIWDVKWCVAWRKTALALDWEEEGAVVETAALDIGIDCAFEPEAKQSALSGLHDPLLCRLCGIPFKPLSDASNTDVYVSEKSLRIILGKDRVCRVTWLYTTPARQLRALGMSSSARWVQCYPTRHVVHQDMCCQGKSLRCTTKSKNWSSSFVMNSSVFQRESDSAGSRTPACPRNWSGWKRWRWVTHNGLKLGHSCVCHRVQWMHSVINLIMYCFITRRLWWNLKCGGQYIIADVTTPLLTCVR